MTERIAHPDNAPGDFYVENGCCMTCEMPFILAAELFAWSNFDGIPHCHVRRQPDTTEELEQMLAAVHAAEAQCIRYRGTDSMIQLRLLQSGDGAVCDEN